MTWSNLAVSHRKQGKYNTAQAMCKDVLEAHEDVLGPKHPESLISADNLAVALRQQGK